MRSRDKLGLLLGLIAIIVIVFVIKGLPIAATSSPQNPSNPANVSQRLRVDTPDLMNDARQAVSIIHETQSVRPRPQDVDNVRNVVAVSPTGKTFYPNSIQSNRSKTGEYIVQSGDTLADIAKKFYGPDDGNKFKNIQKIYQANQNVLESPDRVIEGQKLVIPPLSSVAANKSKKSSKGFLARAFGFGNRVETLSRNSQSKNYRLYKIKKGDTLWKIAAKQLGDGTRFQEIINLNKKQFPNPDDLKVGVTIKLPKS